jgi:predicted nucleotidyltransferase
MMQQVEWTASEILDTLHEHREKLYELGARKLGLFGSYVRGEQTPTSDIDILVTLARPSFNDYSDIKFYLEDLFNREVDLVTEGGLKEGIRPHVLHEVIYAEGFEDTA